MSAAMSLSRWSRCSANTSSGQCKSRINDCSASNFHNMSSDVAQPCLKRNEKKIWKWNRFDKLRVYYYLLISRQVDFYASQVDQESCYFWGMRGEFYICIHLFCNWLLHQKLLLVAFIYVDNSISKLGKTIYEQDKATYFAKEKD